MLRLKGNRKNLGMLIAAKKKWITPRGRLEIDKEGSFSQEERGEQRDVWQEKNSLKGGLRA